MLPGLRLFAEDLWTIFVLSAWLRTHHFQIGNVSQKEGGVLTISRFGSLVPLGIIDG